MAKTRASVIEPMLLFKTEKLPGGPDGRYEIKSDGYRVIAFKTGGGSTCVVIDTNVLISGLFTTTSTPARAIERAATNTQLIATRETLRELIEKLHLPKFDRYVRRERRDAQLERGASLVEIVEVLQSIRASRDAKDDKFLEAAVNGRADVIVTGDHDLLDLQPFRGIAILSPADYLARETSRRSGI